MGFLLRPVRFLAPHRIRGRIVLYSGAWIQCADTESGDRWSVCRAHIWNRDPTATTA